MTVLAYGTSQVDGAPVMALMSNEDTASRNDKTGDVAQVNILRSDVNPYQAVIDGLDESVCGDCEFRPSVALKLEASDKTTGA